MRIVFMGTPEFAVSSLEKLCASHHEVTGVFTQPDRPKGRGLKLTSPPVKQYAVENNLEVFQPENLKAPEVEECLRKLAPDLTVIVAYRILPANLIKVPLQGTINVHASLLPAYRGAAPIQHALFNGETETGATVIRIVPKVDAGNMLMQEKISIGPDEDAGSLHDRLSVLGAELLMKTLERLEKNDITPVVQETAMVTKAPKITREDTFLHWDKPAEWIHNRVRGLSPRPAAVAVYQDRTIKVLRTRLVDVALSLQPGEVGGISKEYGLLVGSGTNPVALVTVQPENKRPMDASAFARGYQVEEGAYFTDGSH